MLDCFHHTATHTFAIRSRHSPAVHPPFSPELHYLKTLFATLKEAETLRAIRHEKHAAFWKTRQSSNEESNADIGFYKLVAEEEVRHAVQTEKETRQRAISAREAQARCEDSVAIAENILKDARQKWALSNGLVHATNSRDAFQKEVGQREKLAQGWQEALEGKVRAMDMYFKASVRRLRAEDEATAARMARIEAEGQRRTMNTEEDAIASPTVPSPADENMQGDAKFIPVPNVSAMSYKTYREVALRLAQERRWELEEEERQRALERAERCELTPNYQAACAKEKERCSARDIQGRWLLRPDWSDRLAIERFKAICEEFDNSFFYGGKPLIPESVPWPLLCRPTDFAIEKVEWEAVERFFEALECSVDAVEYKALVRKAQRRFHPDRWCGRRILDTILDEELRTKMDEAVNKVAQAINRKAAAL